MNKREATFRASGSWEKRGTEHGENDLQVGSRVRMTSYDPLVASLHRRGWLTSTSE